MNLLDLKTYFAGNDVGGSDGDATQRDSALAEPEPHPFTGMCGQQEEKRDNRPSKQ